MTTTKRKPPAKTIGRPTKHTDALLRKIVRRFAEGKTFAAIARMAGYPAESTIRQWRRDIPAFSADLARAREERAESFAEQAIDLVDGATNQDLAIIREQVRARQWMAERTAPRQYGANLNLDVDAQVRVESEFPVDLKFTDWPPELQVEFARRVAFMLSLGEQAQGRTAPVQPLALPAPIEGEVLPPEYEPPVEPPSPLDNVPSELRFDLPDAAARPTLSERRVHAARSQRARDEIAITGREWTPEERAQADEADARDHRAADRMVADSRRPRVVGGGMPLSSARYRRGS